MTLQSCPTDIVEATPEQVWDLISSAERFDSWVDAKLIEGPARPLKVGDRFVMSAGPGRVLRVYFHVLGLRRPEEMKLDIRLPLGLVNHEVIQIRPVDPGRCRVTYN